MQQFWEERYKSDKYAYGTEPNAYLRSNLEIFGKSGEILAVADGEGRNGAWLAKHGHEVTSIDGSLNGLKKAEALAGKYGVRINTIAADLTEWAWPDGYYDGIISIFVQFPDGLRQIMHQKIVSALAPGAPLLLQSFSRRQINYTTGGQS